MALNIFDDILSFKKLQSIHSLVSAVGKILRTDALQLVDFVPELRRLMPIRTEREAFLRVSERRSRIMRQYEHLNSTGSCMEESGSVVNILWIPLFQYIIFNKQCYFGVLE